MVANENVFFLFLMYLLSMKGAQAGTADLHGLAGGGNGHYAVPVTSMKEARFNNTIRQQYDFSCGSAALATLLTYHYGAPVTEQAVFTAMYERGDQQKIRREGFSLLDMKVYLEENGYQADGYYMSLDKLAQFNVPAIVLIRDNAYNHFVVVKGVRDGKVLVGDPSVGARVIERRKFESMWLNRIVFAVSNNRDAAAFNTSADWRADRKAPLYMAISRESLAAITLLRPGRNDF